MPPPRPCSSTSTAASWPRPATECCSTPAPAWDTEPAPSPATARSTGAWRTEASFLPEVEQIRIFSPSVLQIFAYQVRHITRSGDTTHGTSSGRGRTCQQGRAHQSFFVQAGVRNGLLREVRHGADASVVERNCPPHG